MAEVEPVRKAGWSVRKYVTTSLSVGFVGGIAFYAVLGPDSAHPPENVQVGLVALLTAAVGVIGLAMGAAIGADGAKDVALVAQDDARQARTEAEQARRDARNDALQARQDDHEAERAVLFADPIRLAAAEFQATGTYILEVARRAYMSAAGDGPGPTGYTRNAKFYDLGQELRLVVRLPRTYKAVDLVVRAVAEAEGFVSDIDAGKLPEQARLVGITAAISDAYDGFENAVRVELGAPEMTEEQKVAGY